MRKVGAMICVLLCIAMLCACGRQAPEYAQPAKFFYCNKEISYNSPNGVISSEIREAKDCNGNVELYLQSYLNGPEFNHLYLLIPSGTKLLSSEIRDTTIHLSFSKELAQLSGVELTTAGACLMLSLHEFSGIDTLILTAEGELMDEKEAFTISMEDIVTMDTVTDMKQ